MHPEEMLLGKTRNTGFVERSIHGKADEFENRIARIVAQRAGIPNADSAIKRLLEASLDAQSEDASTKDNFSMEELETSDDDSADGFAGLISPLRAGEFFERQYRHRGPVLFRGPTGRFSSLMPWEDLNDLVRNREKSRLESYAFSPNVGARLAPQRQGSRIAAKFDADLLEDSIGGPIDQVQPFLVHQVVQWNSAPYTCDRRGAGGGAALPASAGAGAAPGVGGAARDGALLHCGSIRRRRKLTD